MKNLLIFVFLLCIAPQSRADAAGARYHDAGNKFSVVPPPGWEVKPFPVPDKSIVLGFRAKNKGGFRPNITFMLRPNTSLAAFRRETQSSAAAAGNDLLEIKIMRIGGIEADRYTILKQGERPLKFLHIAVFAHDQIYLATATCPPDVWKEWSPAIEECLRSLQIDP